LLAWAEELARVDARGEDLVVESDPRTAFETLTDWERICGLPSACLGPLSTLQERRQAVEAKLTSQGGQSPAYFVGLGQAMGYKVTISEYRPLRAGFRAGARCYSLDWAFAWRVNSQGTSITLFRAGRSCAGERVRTWGNLKLECAFKAAKPEHTDIIFAYAP
jgi:uncharacterized protein YmfQ (DUF2313 family)